MRHRGKVGNSETGGSLRAPSRTSLLRSGSLRTWRIESQRVSQSPACPFAGVKLQQRSGRVGDVLSLITWDP